MRGRIVKNLMCLASQAARWLLHEGVLVSNCTISTLRRSKIDMRNSLVLLYWKPLAATYPKMVSGDLHSGGRTCTRGRRAGPVFFAPPATKPLPYCTCSTELCPCLYRHPLPSNAPSTQFSRSRSARCSRVASRSAGMLQRGLGAYEISVADRVESALEASSRCSLGCKSEA